MPDSNPRFSAWIKSHKTRKLWQTKELRRAIGLSVYQEQTIVVTSELTMEAHHEVGSSVYAQGDVECVPG